MKLYWKVLIVVAILILGWSIYENLIALRHNDQLSLAIDTIRARNVKLISQLRNARGRVTELQSIVSESEQLCSELRNELDKSEIFIKQLRSENKQLAVVAGQLQYENKQLTEFIEQSSESTVGIKSENKLIEQSIDRSLSIVRELRKLYPENGD